MAEKKGKPVVIFILGIILTVVPLAVLDFPVYVDIIVIIAFNIPFFGKLVNFAFWIWAVVSVLVSGPELQHVWFAATLVLEIIFVLRPFLQQCGNARKRAKEIGGKGCFFRNDETRPFADGKNLICQNTLNTKKDCLISNSASGQSLLFFV